MFKPLLAPGEDPLRYPDYFKKLQYPLLCSSKYDGIRCIVMSYGCISRTGKLLPSKQVQEEFKKYFHCDGELIEGNESDYGVYNRTQSHVMSEDKPGDLKFFVFDYITPDYLNKPYYERLELLEVLYGNAEGPIKLVTHQYIDSYDELISYEEQQLELGFEGIMLRNPVAPYKQGRGTFREGIIYKLKRFVDDEAIIIGFEEQMHNNNALGKDELGYAKRSSSKEGLVGADTLGAFICDFRGQEIVVAPGAFNHAERKEIWDERDLYKGAILKFRYFSHGIKDKPRQPRAVGLRSPIDI